MSPLEFKARMGSFIRIFVRGIYGILIHFPVADLCPRIQIISISCSFWETFTKSYIGTSPVVGAPFWKIHYHFCLQFATKTEFQEAQRFSLDM